MNGIKYVLGYQDETKSHFIVLKISRNYRLIARQRALMQKDYKQKLEIRKLIN